MNYLKLNFKKVRFINLSSNLETYYAPIDPILLSLSNKKY